MTTRPPGWPKYWDWFDPLEIIECAKNGQGILTDHFPIELLQNIFFLQQEPKKFIDDFLKRSPKHKGVLFGFDDVDLAGWNASCGPAEAPARYAISISAATFLQHYFALDRLLTVPALLANGSTSQCRSSQKLQFLQIVNGDIRCLFDGDPKTPSSLGIAHDRHYLMRQLLVYCPFFLFLHELSHIEDGHLEYRAKQKEARKYWTLRRGREARAKDSRAMEFLADSNAILRGVEMVTSAASDTPLDNRLFHLKQFGVAVGLNLLLADVADQYMPNPPMLNDPEFKDHPNAGLRLAWCTYLFSDGYFNQIWPSEIAGQTPSKEAKAAVADGISQLLNAWDSLGWERSDPDLNDPAFGPLISEISRELAAPPGFN